MVKEQDELRQRVFVQMKQRLEDRRESFISAQQRRARCPWHKQTHRERELKREELRLRQLAKEDMVRRSKRIEEFKRQEAMEKLQANEKKQALYNKRR